MKIIKSPILFAIVLLVSSCSNDFVDPVLIPDSNDQLNSQKNKTQSRSSGVETYDLHWDTGESHHNFMPTAPGEITIPAPWAGASTQISVDIILDYRKRDGWVLLYNTFSSTKIPSNYFFVLYNKYRGIIRLYYYNASNDFISTDCIIHSLYLEGPLSTGSPIMNFANNTVVDYNENSLFGSTLLDAQLGPKTWYALEYELAFDKNVVNQNYNDNYFSWLMDAAQLSTIELSGTKMEKTIGMIATLRKDKFDFHSNTAVDGTFSLGENEMGFGKVVINGTNDARKFGSDVLIEVEGIIDEVVEAEYNKNILGGIVASKGQHLNFQMDVELKLAGKLNTGITSIRLAIPGQDQSVTSGYLPKYDKPLGVFYISSKPKINVNKVIVPEKLGGGFGDAFWHNPSIDNSSFEVEFNPVIEPYIQNIKKEIVLLDPSIFSILENNGSIETIINTEEDIQSNPGFIKIGGFQNLRDLAVRISFDVVPPNGADKVRIVKTFLADVVY